MYHRVLEAGAERECGNALHESYLLKTSRDRQNETPDQTEYDFGFGLASDLRGSD